MKTIIQRAIDLNKQAEQLNIDLTNHITDKFNSVRGVRIHSGSITEVRMLCSSIIWFSCDSREYNFEEPRIQIKTLKTDELQQHFKNIEQTKEQAQEIFEYVKSFCKEES